MPHARPPGKLLRWFAPLFGRGRNATLSRGLSPHRDSQPEASGAQKSQEKRRAQEEEETRKEARQLFKLLCAQADAEARDLQRAGDFAGALAVYDSMTEVVRSHPRIVAKRARIAVLLSDQAAVDASRLREADVREALAAYDNLPPQDRDPNVRRDLLDLMRKQVLEQQDRLVTAGDEAAALKLYDNLPADLLARPDIMQRRIKLLRTASKRQANAGDVAGALAVFDRPQNGLADHIDFLEHRGYLLHRLGNLHAAREAYEKVLAADPEREEVWHALGKVLADLCRSKELQVHIDNMVSNLPPTMELFRKASRLARRGTLFHLADSLFDDALQSAWSADAPAMLDIAEELLQRGAQGSAVNLLRNDKLQSDRALAVRAGELRARAMDELRRAGRPEDAGPVASGERADTLVVRSILEHAGSATPSVAPGHRGIVIVAASLGAGGIQRQIVELVRQLSTTHRHDVGPIVVLLLGRSSDTSEFFEGPLADLDVKIEFISEVQVEPRSVLPAATLSKLELLKPDVSKAIVPLASRLLAHNPEVVLAMMTLKSLPVVLAASMVGTPRIVVSERNAARRPDDLLRLAYRTFTAQGTGRLATNSVATAREYASWLNVPFDSVRTIYNGTDVDDVQARRDPAAVASYRRSLGVADGVRIVGSVFQARRVKRPQLWIDAAAAIAKREPDVAFVLVGEGMADPDLTTLIALHGLESRFHRPGLHKDVVNWIALMDVVLLTSQFEGTPNVLLEAQALGKPVVATEAGGSAETFLPGETGLLVSLDAGPDEIADAVIRVLGDPGFAARAGEKGPRFIRERFAPARMAAEFVDLCFERDVEEIASVPTESPDIQVWDTEETHQVPADKA